MNIEGQDCSPDSDPYNCYLRDVAPLEVAIKVSSRGNKPLAVVEAQAIAARTFTYNRTWGRDNSTNYHVFVPYYFDTLTSVQQGRVNEAMGRVYYMSYGASDDQPIAAHYGASNDGDTNKSSLEQAAIGSDHHLTVSGDACAAVVERVIGPTSPEHPSTGRCPRPNPDPHPAANLTAAPQT